MDFIFGTLKTDQLRLLHHGLQHKGLQHAYNISPQDPIPGQPVTITINVGQSLCVNNLACYYTTDGSIPSGSRGNANNGASISLKLTETAWDTPAWGYFEIWKGEIPAQTDNTIVRYQISAWADDGQEFFADWPDFKKTIENAITLTSQKQPITEVPFITSEATVFSYSVDSHKGPQWAKDAIIYHIFVDRFYQGDGKKWLQTKNLHKFFGGTLGGIHDKLDYIADLGVNCIWLSPTWPSPTYHGYDITDYYKTEERIGGDQALHTLIDDAHKRGIRVILDLVCNHSSNEHPNFLEAEANLNSKYRNWYTFDDSKLGYDSFFGVKTMPKINLENPETRAWMFDIAQFWLREFDIDGYRLDHANGVGPTFWAEFRNACRAVKPDAFVFGEIVEGPDDLSKYIGRLDGTLDFQLEETLRKTYAWKTMTETEFERFSKLHTSYFPEDFIMPTFIDNHDMDRFLHIANNDKEALRRAAEAQFRLPGPPIIYYGTEVGLSQNSGKDDGQGLEASRLPMLWGADQDSNLLDFYKQLIQARKP